MLNSRYFSWIKVKESLLYPLLFKLAIHWDVYSVLAR
jgi:hypothetical protein